MSTQTSLSELKPKTQSIESMPSIAVGFANLQGFELTQRIAKCFALSDLVPAQYKGNISNCVIAVNMAARIGADPLMVMQNLDVVLGRPAWRAKFLISTVNTCGRFTAIRFEFFGEQGKDTWSCRAWAIEKSTNEKLVGPDISIALAKTEGWYDKKGSKWPSIPQKMLMYRAGAWWSDLYAPELAMGLQTKEEVHDVWDAEKQEDGSFAVNLEALRAEDNQPNTDTNANQTINAETGEITEAPARIPARSLPGDPTSTDWEAWSQELLRMVAAMGSEVDLKKLIKMNEAVFGNLEKMNPPKFAFCMEAYNERLAALGQAVAA